MEACVEVGRFGLDGEVDWLRRDKQVLMVELVKLKQQQQNSRTYLQAMEDRLRKTEMKQQQMMNFLARAMHNPNFLQQLVHQPKGRRKEFVEAITKKRRRPPIDQETSSLGVGELVQGGGGDFVKFEPQDYAGMSDFEVSELDRLAMTLQGLSGSEKDPGEENIARGKEHESRDKEYFDKGFWENLFEEGMEEEIGILGVEQEDELGDVDVLAEQLGYLASSPK